MSCPLAGSVICFSSANTASRVVMVQFVPFKVPVTVCSTSMPVNGQHNTCLIGFASGISGIAQAILDRLLAGDATCFRNLRIDMLKSSLIAVSYLYLWCFCSN